MNSIGSNNLQSLFKGTLVITKQQLIIFFTTSVTLSVFSPMCMMGTSFAQQTTQAQLLSTENLDIPKNQTINLNRVVLALVGILQDKNIEAEARVNAIRALGGMGKQAQIAVPALVKALKDKQPRIRYGAAIALANIGTELKTVFPFIIKALNHKSQLLRSDAALALTNIGYSFKQKAPELSKSELEEIINGFDEAAQILEKFQSDFSNNTIQTVNTFRNTLQQEMIRR